MEGGDGVTAPFTLRTVNDQLWASMYASQYRTNFRLYDQDISLANDADAPEVIVRDAATCATMDQFCHEIAATGFTVQPGGKDEHSERWAGVVGDMLRKCNTREAVYELAGYVFFGRAYAFPNFCHDWQALGDVPGQQWRRPYQLVDMDHRQFIYQPVVEYVDGKPVIRKVKRQFASAASGRYEDETPDFAKNVIELKWGDQAGRLGYGRGLVNSIFFMWRAKTIAMQYGLQGLQRWAEGLLIAKMDPDRAASPGLDNETLANDLLDKLKNMKSGNTMVVGKDAGEIELHETSGTGHQIVAWFINYCDAQIARLVLGSGMPTGAGEEAGSAGSEGKAVVQERTTTRRIQFHRSRIEECLDRTLLEQIHRLNMPQRLAAGIGAAKCPRFKITDDQHKDPLSAMELVKAMRENKMPVLKSWAYEMAGAPTPKPDDEILEAAADPMPPGFGGMGGIGGEDGGGFNKPNAGPERATRPSQFKEGA